MNSEDHLTGSNLPLALLNLRPAFLTYAPVSGLAKGRSRSRRLTGIVKAPIPMLITH